MIKKYGKWTVLSQYYINKRTTCLCKCECGIEREIPKSNLTTGRTLQCNECRQKGRTKVDSLYLDVYRRYKRQAVKRGKGFNLTLKEFMKIVSKPCHYCGAKNSLVKSSRHRNLEDRIHFYHNGIDRFDNNKPYDTNNSVPCCKNCNYMKLELTYDEFIDHIRKICDHSLHLQPF